jgi:cobalt/nickel transport system permease protein
VAAGTSAHLLGGTLLAIRFGPWSGFLVMTAVLIAQAFIFADGGLTALGANALNIAGGGALAGYAAFRALSTLTGEGARRRSIAAAAAAYFATLVTGTAAGLELGLSGVAPTRLAVGAMAGVHAVIGLAEALITGLVVWALARRRADLFYRAGALVAPAAPRAALLAALGALATVAGGLALIASTAPDALERVAIDLGFASAESPWPGAPFPDYRAWLPGPAGTVVAVLFGVALLFAGVTALLRALALARAARER